MSKKIAVTFFQRKPRPNSSFSLEYIFADIRNRLSNYINADVKISKLLNNGYFSKFYNIIEAAFRQNKNINHITGEIHFLNLLMRKKSVILTILDCGMMHRKKGLAKYIVNIIYLSWPVKRSTFVTAISEYTKNEIISYTNCPANKIFVIPVAIDPIYKPLYKKFNTSKPCILQIGTAPNKNLHRLIEAIKGINCHLTIIGKIASDTVAKLNEYLISYSNEYNLSQAELLTKYHNCDIVSFVSTFEGFGMPIIEANAVERIVITSNLFSMPEVAANAACLVDPFNTEDIRNGLLKIINDENYRAMLIENGRTNKLRFDPDKIAKSYCHLYQKLSSQKSQSINYY